jgi:hypothetical protein
MLTSPRLASNSRNMIICCDRRVAGKDEGSTQGYGTHVPWLRLALGAWRVFCVSDTLQWRLSESVRVCQGLSGSVEAKSQQITNGFGHVHGPGNFSAARVACVRRMGHTTYLHAATSFMRVARVYSILPRHFNTCARWQTVDGPEKHVHVRQDGVETRRLLAHGDSDPCLFPLREPNS